MGFDEEPICIVVASPPLCGLGPTAPCANGMAGRYIQIRLREWAYAQS